MKLTVNRQYIFSFIFAISFILNGYASGIPGVSVGSLAFGIMVLASFKSGKATFTKQDLATFYFLCTMLLLSVVSYFIVSNLSILTEFSFIGICKLILWALMITLVKIQYFDFDKILMWLLRISIILTIYILIQTVAFYGASIYLPNIFDVGFLHPYADEYANYEALSSSQILRAGSLLSEASFYGNYVLCTLILYLDRNIYQFNKKNICLALFLSIGIIVSTSTSAIVFLTFVWIIYLNKRKINKCWLLLLGMFSLAIIFVFSGAIQILFTGDNPFLNSLKYAFEKFQYLDTSSRVGKSFEYLTLMHNEIKVMGVGVGNDLVYLRNLTGNGSFIYINSVTSLILQTGYMGVISFVIFISYIYYKIFKQNNTAAFVLLTIYFIKGFASTIYFSTYGIMFMFLIMGSMYIKRRVSDE